MNKGTAFFIIPLIAVWMGIGVLSQSEDANATRGSIEDVTVLSFSLPDIKFDTVKGTEMIRLAAEGLGSLSTPGVPEVLVKSMLLEVPCCGEIEVIPTIEEQKMLPEILLAPVPKTVLEEENQGTVSLRQVFEKNATLYGQAEAYPGKYADVEFIGYLRDKRVAKINLYPIQYNPATRELVLCKKMKVRVCHRPGDDTLKQSHMPRREQRIRRRDRDRAFEHIYRTAIMNYIPSEGMHPSLIENIGEAQPQRSLSTGIQQSPFAVKLMIDESGIYKITYEDLLALGIDLSGTTNENLAMENQGQEIALYCSGSGRLQVGDYILFYGQAYKSLYSKTNVYWLYQKNGQGKRMLQRTGTPGSGETQQTLFQTTLHFEKDLLYWSNIPPYDEGVDHWFWDRLSIIEEPLKKDFSVTVGKLVKNAGSYTITLNMQGQTGTGKNPDHHTRVYVNNNLAGDFTWDGQVELTQDISGINPTFFNDGENIITIEAVADTDSQVDSYYINWIEITHNAAYTAANDRLLFYNHTTGTIGFTINGFSDSDVVCLEITKPGEPVMITGAAVAGQSPSVTVRFRDTVTDRTTYYAASKLGMRTPLQIAVDTPSNLTTFRPDVDYIIITHEDFYDAVQELKSYREGKGLRVEVVKIQDIYDEFSYGIKNAQAIKDFLTFAYNNWNSNGHPEYVLLVGDASIDYRDDMGLYAKGAIDYVPTFLYQTNEFGDTPTDNWFACVNGSDYLPDMLIGRISIKNSTDLKNVIAKIKAYEQASPAAWCGNVILAADNESIFESVSDTLATMIPDGFQTKKVYLDTYPSVSSATVDLIGKINAGALITNYAGHGHIDEWAKEYLFHTYDQRKNNTRDDLTKLTNGDKLTFLITLTCLNGYFPHWIDDYSLAEDFLRVENKGAIACFAPTALGYPSEHGVLARRIFSGLFEDGNNIVGSLVTTAKIGTYTQISSRDIVETFTLFGDPATELKLVSGGEFKAFRTLTPDEGDALPFIPLPTFTWGPGLYDRFKVQFSSTPDFTPDTTITVPLMPLRFLNGTSYTPPFFIWLFVNMMGRQSGQLYWRVAAYDEDFNQIAFTDYARFTVQR
ncbi:MAG: C25 family cysteine peptidase [Desulfobacterota bacterium]|nr:C25 family cysteine peptidase [Thermodesulfobacteriota bacterium]